MNMELHQKVLEAVSCKQPMLIELENRKLFGKIVGLGSNLSRSGEPEKVATVIVHQNPDELWEGYDSGDDNGQIMDINYNQVKSLEYLRRG